MSDRNCNYKQNLAARHHSHQNISLYPFMFSFSLKCPGLVKRLVAILPYLCPLLRCCPIYLTLSYVFLFSLLRQSVLLSLGQTIIDLVSNALGEKIFHPTKPFFNNFHQRFYLSPSFRQTFLLQSFHLSLHFFLKNVFHLYNRMQLFLYFL